MVISRRRALVAVSGVLGLVLTACAPAEPPAAQPTQPTLDFTVPGVAKAMVSKLLTDTGSTRALQVKITEHTVEVTTLDHDRPATWAYRGGTISQVTSDLQYVDQATFTVDRFTISDVGALFRAAAGQSGSDSNQTLTIVDPSGGDVTMSVSTEPESRTVFFNDDGSLTPVLDFNTKAGLTAGLQEAIGTRMLVYSVSVISNQSVSAEFSGPNSTTVRRTRATKVPPVTTVRSTADLRQFSAARVSAAAIWRVVSAVRGADGVPINSEWSVTVDNRDKLIAPRMYFSFGFKVVVADLEGNIIQ